MFLFSRYGLVVGLFLTACGPQESSQVGEVVFDNSRKKQQEKEAKLKAKLQEEKERQAFNSKFYDVIDSVLSDGGLKIKSVDGSVELRRALSLGDFDGNPVLGPRKRQLVGLTQKTQEFQRLPKTPETHAVILELEIDTKSLTPTEKPSWEAQSDHIKYFTVNADFYVPGDHRPAGRAKLVYSVASWGYNYDSAPPEVLFKELRQVFSSKNALVSRMNVKPGEGKQLIIKMKEFSVPSLCSGKQAKVCSLTVIPQYKAPNLYEIRSLGIRTMPPVK